MNSISSVLLVIYSREIKMCGHTRNLFTNIHDRLVCSSLIIISPQVNFIRWVVKHTLIYTYHLMLFSKKRRDYWVIVHTITRINQQRVMLKIKPVSEDHVLSTCFSVTFLKWHNLEIKVRLAVSKTRKRAELEKWNLLWMMSWY